MHYVCEPSRVNIAWQPVAPLNRSQGTLIENRCSTLWSHPISNEINGSLQLQWALTKIKREVQVISAVQRQHKLF